jgi:hypothetical protein
MNLTISVVDVGTGNPVPYVGFAVNGGTVQQSDKNGVFTVAVTDSDNITVSDVGYSTFTVPVAIIEENNSVIQLSRLTSYLPAAVVTPQSADKTGGSLLPLGLGVLALLALSSGKKSVGAVKKTKLLPIALLGVGGYLLLTKKPGAQTATTTTPVKPGTVPAPGGGLPLNPGGLLDIFKNLFGGGGGSTPPPDTTLPPLATVTPPLDPIFTGPIDPGSGVGPIFTTPPDSGGWDSPPVDIATDYSSPVSSSRELQNMAGVPSPGLLGIGVLGAMALLSRPKRGMGGFDASGLIIPGVLVVGGYLLFKNFFGKSTSPADQQTIKSIQDSVDQAAQVEAPSFSDAQYTGAANAVYNLGLNEPFFGDNFDQMLSTVTNVVKSLTDWLKIKQAFGIREASSGFFSSCNFTGMACPTFDLDAFLKNVWDQSHTSQLNSFFSQNSINYSL